MSLGDEVYRFLLSEAKSREITVQELLKVVIIPRWVRQNAPAEREKPPIRPLIPA